MEYVGKFQFPMHKPIFLGNLFDECKSRKDIAELVKVNTPTMRIVCTNFFRHGILSFFAFAAKEINSNFAHLKPL